ncbi:MAG: amidase [Myxococcales bacterium]|jgi:amidase
MGDEELAILDATAQAELVRARKCSPRELVDAALARLERHNPTLGAVIHPCPDRARARADALQDALSRGEPAGPFAGVPMVMKDIGGAEAGQPYHAGMRALKDADHRAPEDAFITRRLRVAGLVSLGRTNLPELAILPTTEPDAYGPTLNPWNLEHSAGGSSGGSAAAVAAGIVPIGHASDGGGSIRGPANLCGLVGLKPTRARISFGPALGERWSSLSCEFALSRSVRDAAILLDALEGAMPGDPYVAPPPREPFTAAITRPPASLRIGVMRVAPRGGQLAPECVQAVDAMAATLEALGHDVEEAHPAALDERDAGIHWFTIVAVNTARTLDSYGALLDRELSAADVEPLTWALAEQGRKLPAHRWLQTIEFVHAYGRRLRAFWYEQGFDLLLSPVQAALAPELGYISSTPEEPLRAILRAPPYGSFTLPMNLSGQPAISLPTLVTDDNLPVGIQLTAEFAREDLLLSIAAQIEKARPWTDHRPQVFG